MSVESFEPIPVDVFGSLVKQQDPADVALGLSPDNQDVEFYPGGVRTRPGTAALYTGLGATPGAANMRGLKTFIDNALNKNQLTFSDDGVLACASGAGVMTALRSTLPAHCMMCSETLFDAEFIGISDGTVGKAPPMQYLNGILDRVSQDGPASVLSCTEVAVLVNVAGTQTAVGDTLTVTIPSTAGLQAGLVVFLEATSTYGVHHTQMWRFNGPILQVLNGTQFTITVAPGTGSAWPANVTVNQSGDQSGGIIPAGVHLISFFYITRSGFWTKMAPPTSFTASGTGAVQVSIPSPGPANVVAIGVCMTTAGGATFYHVASQMLINSNTAATITFGMVDTTLAAGLDVTYLLNLRTLGYAAKPVAYNSRLMWLGEENALPGFANLGFEGGGALSNAAGPSGWSWANPSNTPAGGSFGGGDPGDANCWYRITGDGVTNPIGLIWQTAYQDQWTQQALLQAAVAYRVRFRARCSNAGGLAQGQLNVALYSPSLGVIGKVSILATALTNTWQEFDGLLTAGIPVLPADLLLEVYADQTLANGAYIDVDEIRILPANQLINASLARCSLAGDAESYQGTDGFMLVSPDDGQALRNAFDMNTYLYLVKEHSVFSTQDDGVNEPAQWTISDALDKVNGTQSFMGVARLGNAALICSRTGPIYFDGGTCANIGGEIQNQDPGKSLWDAINFAGAGPLVWVVANTTAKRALFGVPLNGATQCNVMLCLDWSDPPMSPWFPTLITNPLTNQGKGRKWTIWNRQAACGAILETANGPVEAFGSNYADGTIFVLQYGLRQDYNAGGIAINGYYDVAYLGGVGFGRRLFGYLVAAIEGSGQLLLSMVRPGSAAVATLPTRSLQSPNQADLNLPLNVTDSRLSLRVQTNAIGAWFSCPKLVLYDKQDPFSGGM